MAFRTSATQILNPHVQYNLTDSQKNVARWIVEQVRTKKIAETFTVGRVSSKGPIVSIDGNADASEEWKARVNISQLDALAEVKLLHVRPILFQRNDGAALDRGRTCTLTGAIYKAVDNNFAEELPLQPISTLAQPHPPEIAMSLDRFRTKYPDPKKVGFLIMRFTAAQPFAAMVEVIRETGQKHGLFLIRADENEFHADLWGNVRTHLHGCGFGIAIYERIETDEPNANVGLEVGYLFAMNKPVLLLKDKTVAALQADLAGRLYKQFDPHDPEGTIPIQLEKWLCDNGIILSQGGE